MAKAKRTKTNNPAVNKAAATKAVKQGREEELNWKEVAKDERTKRIIGVVFIAISLVLFISLGSYFFTWQHDQSIATQGFSAAGDGEKAKNQLGVFGAVVSHILIFKGFGIAALLIGTFFFVVGINILFRRKVFSINKNLKYVTLGMLVLSVTLAFIAIAFSINGFPLGGEVGKMISDKLVSATGMVGTAFILALVFFSYYVWQFNPSFNFKRKSTIPSLEELDGDVEGNIETNVAGNGEEAVQEHLPEESNDAEHLKEPLVLTINEKFAADNGNRLTSDAGTMNYVPEEETAVLPEMHLVEKTLQIEDVQKSSTAEKTATERVFVEMPDIAEPADEDDIENITAGSVVPQSEEIFTIEAQADENETETEKVHPVVLPVTPAKKTVISFVADDMPLEINNSAEEIEDETNTVEEEIKAKPLAPYEPTLDLRDYQYPSLDLLETHNSEKIVHDPAELDNNKNQIIGTLRNYAIEIQKISATIGPTVTLYEIVPAAGVRISRIKNLEDDIALSLAALGIRIIAPIPGKGTIGIEVPNAKKTIVGMRSLLASDKFQNNNYSLPIAIGKKIDNENFIVDLASMPHLLMAGATGQGKSVGLNAILVSLLYKKHPSQLKFVLVDPKKVELSIYSVITNHFLASLPNEEEAIITDTKKVINTLNALCIEMDNRYDLLKDAGCRNIKEYNTKFTARKLNPEKGHQYLPFIVLVVDEFADLIMTAGKEVEMPIARLAQLARAIGIHLIIATQRPSVNIITGTIKANFPARIAFKVSSKIDSRTILDAGGAEQLIGKGDMLISNNGEIVRLQCAFVDTPEVDRICDFIGYQVGYPQPFYLPEYIDEKDLENKEFDLGDRDSVFEDAARLIVQNQVGSTSLIQRRMKLGYNRAGRLMDQLEAAGIVGPNKGSKPRDVLIKTEMELEEFLSNL